jgi:hypothetical protein
MNEQLKQKLIKLIQENPDLPVRAQVDSELFCDDCVWMLGDIADVNVETIYTYNEKYYVGKNQLIEELKWTSDFETEKELHNFAKECPKEKVILISVGA